MPSGTIFDSISSSATRIAVPGLALLHDVEGTHAPVHLVGAALVEHHFARGLVGSGEEIADHDHVGPCGEGLGDVAGKLDAAIGDDGDAPLPRRPSPLRRWP